MSEKTLHILEITFIEIDVKSTKVYYRRKCIFTAYQFLILRSISVSNEDIFFCRVEMQNYGNLSI